MAIVWIPALLRSLTIGERQVTVAGSTVAEVVDRLDAAYPGISDRLCQEGHLRPGIALTIDGVFASRNMDERLTSASELHFVPAIGGGLIPPELAAPT